MEIIGWICEQVMIFISTLSFSFCISFGRPRPCYRQKTLATSCRISVHHSGQYLAWFTPFLWANPLTMFNFSSVQISRRIISRTVCSPGYLPHKSSKTIPIVYFCWSYSVDQLNKRFNKVDTLSFKTFRFMSETYKTRRLIVLLYYGIIVLCFCCCFFFLGAKMFRQTDRNKWEW